ncbi:MAG: adenylate/guanylate cyclase domain-containing protein [Alphaproteobacteria bacterium]|nr:adenylate/guanylate cyclase domain-containing protein [Alphaproteobacteria bacterium]
MPDDREPQTDLAGTADDHIGGPLLDTVADWLMDRTLDDSDLEQIYRGCCERLAAAGIPVWRAHVAYHTIHPLFQGMGLTWVRGQETEYASYVHRDAPAERWRTSPLYYMIENRVPHLRRRLVGEEALVDFPLLAELRDSGATDYLAFIVSFGSLAREDAKGIAGSWATDRPGGFTDAQITALMRIERRLAVAFKVTIEQQITHNVAAAYLGPDAGEQVLNGVIQRGAGEHIHAVIWYSDLRGSTAMADALPADDYIAILNRYFEVTAGAVLASGGDVLDFIGDAVLGIFPIRAGQCSEAEACEKALAAAGEARTRLAELNAQRAAAGEAPLDYGLALHVGSVMYGNIGVPDRLAFSVIGHTVNEVARLEALTKTLNRPVLASEAFARNLKVPWDSLGAHELPGLSAPIEVFAPPEA